MFHCPFETDTVQKHWHPQSMSMDKSLYMERTLSFCPIVPSESHILTKIM
jgi:hypothetical protein